MFKGKFKDIVAKDDGFLRGPFGSALKKSLFVSKSDDTYKVYEQGVVLEQDNTIGNYYISKEYYDSKMSRFATKAGDFLVSCSGVNYGAIYQLPNDSKNGVINQALLRIRLNNDIIDNDYFLYYFNTYISKVITGGTGDSTIPNFPPMQYVKNIDIELPELEVQKKISSVLKNIDKKIENNNKINTELESMAKIIYDYWFLQFEFPNEEGKPYKSNGGKMVWNEELKRKIPEGWEVGCFKDIISELECGNRPKGGIIDSINNGIPSIGAENIISIGKYDFSSEKYIPQEYFNSLKKGIVKSNDVLIYKDGAGIGHVSMAKNNFPHEKCAINSHVFIVRSKYNNLYQNYIYLTLEKNYIKKILVNLAMKAAQPGLNQPNIESIPIIIPTKNIIKEFNKSIDVIFDKIFLNANENKELTSLRDFLLPLLMNGQVGFKEVAFAEE
ncbi:restriction endonuclease subunit S [Intestinibacter sp.]|uniref:restriction endonuclease subunit S n=1 Tax=Intestinibacter sp. TaxID=1965304 RepID=UPI003AB31323